MDKNKGLLLIFGTALISGVSVFVNKFGVSVINPYIFTGLKNALVGVLFLSLILIAKDWLAIKKTSVKQRWSLALIGLIGGAIPFLLFFKGLSMTSGAQAAFIHKTMFVFVFVFAAVMLGERIKRLHIIAGLLLLIGNMALLKILPLNFGWGDVFILLATIFWALENVISKRLLSSLSYRVVAGARMFIGSIFIMIFLLATNQLPLVADIGMAQIGWIMITSVLLFGYVLTWYAGLSRVRVSTAAVVLSLAAPITSILSLVFSQQALWLGQALSIALIMAAVIAVIKSGHVYDQNKSTRTI